MEAVLAVITIGAASALACYGLAVFGKQRRIVREMSKPHSSVAKAASGTTLGYEAVLDVMADAFERLPLDSAKRRLRGWCMRAGIDERFGAERLVALAALGACAGTILCEILLWHHIVRSMAVGCAGGCGFVAWWISARMSSRRQEIERELPTVLDMLTLSVEAGMDFGQAMSRIAQVQRNGVLHDELARMAREMGIGVTRRDALMHLADRTAVPSVRSLVSTLVQADRLGTSIGPVLRMQADRMRAERIARAERRAVLAGQKVLIPLVLFVMPVTFIVVLGPLVARYLAGGLSNLF